MPSRHVVSLAAVFLMPLPASAAETIWTEIVVRVYDSSGARGPERRAALAIAASIVAPAAVELVWRTCDSADPQRAPSGPRGVDPCHAPLAPRELALRIVRSVPVDAQRPDLPLGNALINTDAGAGVLATVYIDRVDWVAERTGVHRDTLLGRAIAHELGHLLMASSLHYTRGLMRGMWTRSEIRRRQERDWVFGPGEIAAIKARASTRRGASSDRLLMNASGLSSLRPFEMLGCQEWSGLLPGSGERARALPPGGLSRREHLFDSLAR
jgi:hypothetical protein